MKSQNVLNRTFILLSVLCFLLIAARGQNISGYWEGKIKVGKSDSLAVGLFITHTTDTLYAELDSPDQYFFGQHVDEISFDSTLLQCHISSLNIRYSGNYDKDKDIVYGMFFQNGAKLKLDLHRGHQRKIVNRPQTPLPPFNYSEQEIVFRNRHGKYPLINGTLTMPHNPPKALVIFITGSGWQDRDETLFAHKPFAVIADKLTNAGYATFRYDDFPPAVFRKSTTEDFAEAVRLILDSITDVPVLKNTKIGLLGHSEGSLVAFMAAATDPRISFTIHLGGVALPINEILEYQTACIMAFDTTFSDKELDNTLETSRSFYKIATRSKSIDDCYSKLSEQWDKLSEKMSTEEKIKYKMTANDKFTTLQSLVSPWYFYLFHLDPKKYIKKIKSPVLAISGEKDLQVPAVKSINSMKKCLKNKKNSDFFIVENLNHLLQPCINGTPDEYPVIETTISENVIGLIIEWLDKQTTDKNGLNN